MADKVPSFHGWATKTGIKCSDGRTILENAFADQDGQTVPLVWQHFHDDPEFVLGHAVLHNKKGGVYADCYLNNSPKAQTVKPLIENGDIKSLSIYANQLKQKGGDVMHGVIRELSVVIAGANMGATIDNVVLAHGDSMDELEDEAIIHSDESEQLLFLEHADDKKEDEKMADKTEEKDRTVQDVIDGMSEEQKNVMYYLIGQAMENGDKEDSDDGEEAKHSDDNGEVLEMKSNVFDKDTQEEKTTMSHADQMKIIDRAKRLGSMHDAIEEAKEEGGVLAHAVYNDDGSVQTYGVANIDYLFPEYQELNNTPEMIKRDDAWVATVMNGVSKKPFARIKTTQANITMDEARAKGYIKGQEKKEEVFNLLRRTVDPQTVYKKQKFDKDDVTDITDFDVITWVKGEMRVMLNEEIARAILIGDGRSAEDEDKIKSDHIKPIWTDDDLYAVKVNVVAGSGNAATAENLIDASIRARKNYKGSGNLILFTSEDWLCECLLLKDQIGHRLYKTEQELATAMRVSKIVTVPQFENLTRPLTGGGSKSLIGIAVDLKDYATGTNRRGQVEMFDDFDIDFNQYKYLIETRLSGMLVKPYSALVFEIGSSGVSYTEASPVGSENPKALGWYEKEGDVYRKSTDTTLHKNASNEVDKTYYVRGTY